METSDVAIIDTSKLGRKTARHRLSIYISHQSVVRSQSVVRILRSSHKVESPSFHVDSRFANFIVESGCSVEGHQRTFGGG